VDSEIIAIDESKFHLTTTYERFGFQKEKRQEELFSGAQKS